MNGRAWTAAEIAALVTTVGEGGNTFALCHRLSRSHEALMAKARRLGLTFAIAPEPFAEPH